ncbi:MAG TPA: VWA domain-containing protein [Vicinamibacterales bacterium]|nr:VWA domain-containing protein [Vicinamibacterales bacterium]
MIFTLFTSFMVCAPMQAQTQNPPVFRTRTDLLQLDVTVLDKTGKPVKGLTADDFIILEDKQPQKVEAFTAIDIPDTPPPAAVWANKVSPDVTTNEDGSQRIFVIVIDDAQGMGKAGRLPDLWALREMKKTVALFIDSLSAVDAVALVYTNGTRESQNLTTDHAKIVKAIQAYPEDGGDILADSCLGQMYSRNMIGAVVDHLATIPDRRKAIVYWGAFLPYMNDCGSGFYWDRILQQAQQAHVTINPIDTMGLRFGSVASDKYKSLADDTGGYAVVDSNDFAPGIRRIFLENSSYYLMAYAPTNDVEDGRFRRVSVSIKGHPEFEVRTRRSYWADKRKPGDAEPAEPPPNLKSVAGLLPESKLSLRATAAPFVAPAGEGADIAITLGIRQPPFAQRTPEQVELLINAYTADGDPRGSDSQTISVTVPAAKADRDVTRYEVLARLPLPKPGKYQIRLSAHSLASDTRGGVYVDVEVPDFAKDAVSLSGVVINNALAADPVAPVRILRDVVPVVPTSERSFVPTDVVTAFLRVYQGGKVSAIPIKTTVTDAAGKVVVNKSDTIKAEASGEKRAADYQLRLPLADLKAGDYLLTFEAMVGKVTARRDVRFSVR